MRAGDRVAYARAFQYNCLGQLVSVSEQQPTGSGRTTAGLTHINYTRAGHLLSLRDERASWTFHHDANGNVVSVDYGLGSVTMAYEHGERVSAYGVGGGGGGGQSQVVSYANDTGNMIRRHDYEFVYNDLNQLVQIWRAGVLRKEIDYDVRGRVVRMTDGPSVRDAAATSLVYMMADRPWLVTHVGNNGGGGGGGGGPAVRLTYGRWEQLVAMEVGEKLYTVVTSSTGTPVALLEDGKDIPVLWWYGWRKQRGIDRHEMNFRWTLKTSIVSCFYI